MHSEMYKIQHGDYTFVTEIDTGAEVGTNQVTLWFREQGRDGGLQFLRAFYFEEANDDNIHTFCREFALYPDYRREILTGQRHWTKRNALFVRNLYSVLGEQVLLASDPGFERRAREFFRWLDLHAEEILALDDYKKFKNLDNASQPHTALLDPLIQPVVALLRQIPGVATRFSCQGISGKVRFQEHELMAVSPHQEYAYVSFESLSYFAHDSIVAQLPNFPHVTLARIPCNFASEFHLRSTGNNQRFLAELMTLAQSLLATRQGNKQNPRAERKLTRWETAIYPERRPRIAAPGGILPSRLEWLCRPEQIERTLRLLFHLNHWAKASASLFYVDRQGLYAIKAAFIQQAYVAHALQPVAYIDGIVTFARDFTIEMATDIAAEFLLDRLSLLFEKGRRSSVADSYDTAARKLFERISGHTAMSVIDIKTITHEQARKYIHVTLQELIEQARLTRQPISYDELAALLIGPTDLLALPYNRERLVEFWHDLDETNARKLDPEGSSLIAFQYSRAETRYTFHLPFRVAERFLPLETLQGLQERHTNYSRELGVYYGRSITEAESRACNLLEILDELAINIDDLCPRKLANKEEIYTPFLREHWEMGDEEDEEGRYEEEIYGSGRSKGTKRGSRSEYRAQRHLQLLCPLCKHPVADTVSARIAHWRQAHPKQDLTISQATWVLRQGETELKASKLKPDYQALGPQSNQNGTRYWKLTTLEIHAARETIHT